MRPKMGGAASGNYSATRAASSASVGMRKGAFARIEQPGASSARP